MSGIFLKKKYIAVFLVREQNTYSLLRKKKFNPEAKTIRFKKGVSHEIKVANPTYSQGLNMYFFIDIKTGQLTFSGDKKAKYSPELIDMIVHDSIIRQIVVGLQEKLFGGKLWSLIGALAMGVMLGFIIGGFVY